MTSHTPRTHGDALSGAFGGLPARSPARPDFGRVEPLAVPGVAETAGR